ncbi:hypothetical protein BJY01DRAFT_215451 [Aspergillus pseudoustus]|uniref:Uncharacterized protein n=1 Tax=Aspergillus pseudoustus TaxID=1810923 RepID=A0ABR4JUK6_9EURO
MVPRVQRTVLSPFGDGPMAPLSSVALVLMICVIFAHCTEPWGKATPCGALSPPNSLRCRYHRTSRGDDGCLE